MTAVVWLYTRRRNIQGKLLKSKCNRRSLQDKPEPYIQPSDRRCQEDRKTVADIEKAKVWDDRRG